MDLGDPSTRDRLAYGSFVSLRYRYLYLATPKAACTKTKAILWRLEGLGQRDPWPTGVHDRRRYDGRISLADCGPETVRHILSSADWLRFCFVRNPYSRLISAYRSKIASGDRQFGPFREQLARYGGLRSAEPGGIPFELFVRYVCEQDDADRDEHWRTQSYHLFIDRIRYGFIGRVENYAADMAYVLGRLGAPPRFTADLQQKVNASGAPAPAPTFNDALAALVRRKYQDDFNNFGYEAESYGCGQPC